MNEKIQAILLSIILELKKLGWVPSPDWEITLNTEKKGLLNKNIPVESVIKGKHKTDNIEILLELTINSEDKITYFPNFTIYGYILVRGNSSRDIIHTTESDVSFMESDVKNIRKFKSAASKINRHIENYIQSEYTSYLDDIQKDIEYYNSGERGIREEYYSENDF